MGFHQRQNTAQPFLDNSMNVSDESGQYTLLLIADAGYTTEFNKLTPYFKTGSPDSTNNLAGFHLVKDFAFKGVYLPSQLPVTLVSAFGVHVTISSANVQAMYKTSNGCGVYYERYQLPVFR